MSVVTLNSLHEKNFNKQGIVKPKKASKKQLFFKSPLNSTLKNV